MALHTDVVPGLSLRGGHLTHSSFAVTSVTNEAPLVLKAAAKQLCDECISSPAAGPPVELGHQRIINGNVQSHVSPIPHWPPTFEDG